MQRYREALEARPDLLTPRLVLRRPGAGDAAAIVAIAGDWEVASRLERVPHPYHHSDVRFFLDTVVPAELVWAIIERETGQIVGMIGVSTPDLAAATVELGYYVAQTHWGRGIATEAGSVIVAYAIGLLGYERLTARCFEDNRASARVLAKLGFRPSGYATNSCLATGTDKSSIVLRMITSEAGVG